MKRVVIFLAATLCLQAVNAQFVKNVLNNAKWKSEQKVNEKVNQQIDKTVDGTGKKKGTDSSAKKSTNTTGTTAGNPGNQSTGASSEASTNAPNTSGTLTSYSKFDFIAGDKVLAVEDFSQDAIGDFPDKWNTNSTGEVMTIEGQSGKWLSISKEGVFLPEFITNLPENFTLEFDVICNPEYSFYSSGFYCLMAKIENLSKEFSHWQGDRTGEGTKDEGVRFWIHPESAGGNMGHAGFAAIDDNQVIMHNEDNTPQFVNKTKNKVHVAIWRQKTRARLYLNEEKVFDLPRAFPEGMIGNAVIFSRNSGNKPTDRYLFSNIKLAVGAPDTRNKLISEGKFVSHGILFDVNSDKIRPESYGALKDIAGVLKENPDVKIKIVGHTDSDGSDADNLTLSKKRAESVKSSLEKDFGLDASRMETDGKGESQPIDKNENAVGKANNRRVEFIKM